MNDSVDVGDNTKVDPGYLSGVLNELANLKKTVGEAAGSLRQRLNQILENTTWNKRALAHIREIQDMSDTKRADYLRSFEPMFDAMMEHEWRDTMDDLFSGEEENGSDEQGDAEK